MAVSTIKKTDALETIHIATGVNAYRRGNVVTVIFNNAVTTSTTARTTYGTLPVGWRPPDASYAVEVNSYNGYGVVTQTGDVQGFRKSATGNVSCVVTYVTA